MNRLRGFLSILSMVFLSACSDEKAQRLEKQVAALSNQVAALFLAGLLIAVAIGGIFIYFVFLLTPLLGIPLACLAGALLLGSFEAGLCKYQ